MDDVAAIIYNNIKADAQKSASACRVVLSYESIGKFSTMSVVIRRVAHGYYEFDHAYEIDGYMARQAVEKAERVRPTARAPRAPYIGAST